MRRFRRSDLVVLSASTKPRVVDRFFTQLALTALCSAAVIGLRYRPSVMLAWTVVIAAAGSVWISLANEQRLVAAWSFAAIIVGLLPIITRRGAAADALAVVAAAWLDDSSSTVLLWLVATASSSVVLAGAGVFLPLIALAGSTTGQANSNGFASVVVCTLVMAMPCRPSLANRQSLGAPVLLAILIGQLRVQFDLTILPDWVLGAGVLPAAAMLFLLGGGRGLRAEVMGDVLASIRAVSGGCVLIAGAAAATVPESAGPWLLASLSMLVTAAGVTAMRPRPSTPGTPETLELLAGQGRGAPVVMATFTLLLLSLLTCLPLSNGWLWLYAAGDCLQASRLQPQPGFLLTSVALAASTTLAPPVIQLVISIWFAESRGQKLRFRPLSWTMAAIALGGPPAAIGWLVSQQAVP